MVPILLLSLVLLSLTPFKDIDKYFLLVYALYPWVIYEVKTPNLHFYAFLCVLCIEHTGAMK